MTAAEFKAARAKLKLSQSQLAIILNVDVRSIKHWEAGTRDVNPVAVRAIFWLSQGFEPPEMALVRRR